MAAPNKPRLPLTHPIQVIDALGGRYEAARLLGITNRRGQWDPRYVDHWERNGVPAKYALAVMQLLAERGHTCDPAILGQRLPKSPTLSMTSTAAPCGA